MRPGNRKPKPLVDVPPPIKFSELPSLSRITSVVMLMIGIAVVGVLFYRVMAGFFVPLFLAALLVVIFRPVHDVILRQTANRKRLSAAITTTLIALIVLMPLAILVSIATTQLTLLIGQTNPGTLSQSLDRVRERLSLTLPHPEHFRELDRISDSLSLAPVAEETVNLASKAAQLDRAAAILTYLQADEPAGAPSAPAAKSALANIREFAGDLKQLQASLDAPVLGQASTAADPSVSLVQLDAAERFEKNAVITAAAIRSWMHARLGGAVWSQMRLIANPGEADFAAAIRQTRDALQPRFVRLTSATGSFVVQLVVGTVVLVIAVFFFLLDGSKMIRTLMRLSPMDDTYEHQLLIEFDRTSRAVVLASVASAVVQGILATMGYLAAGFDQVVLLFLITTMLALVPFLGAASVWVPCVIWLAVVEDRLLAAALLGIWGAAVVSSIDNVIKVYVLQGRSQLHPLFALLSVLGGVTVFGPIGILVGPMIVVFLQTLLEILNHELAVDRGEVP